MPSHLLDYAVMALNDQSEENSFRSKSAFSKLYFFRLIMAEKKKSTQSTRGRSKSKTAKPKKVNYLLPRKCHQYEVKGLKVKIEGEK